MWTSVLILRVLVDTPLVASGRVLPQLWIVGSPRLNKKEKRRKLRITTPFLGPLICSERDDQTASCCKAEVLLPSHPTLYWGLPCLDGSTLWAVSQRKPFFPQVVYCPVFDWRNEKGDRYRNLVPDKLWLIWPRTHWSLSWSVEEMWKCLACRLEKAHYAISRAWCGPFWQEMRKLGYQEKCRHSRGSAHDVSERNEDCWKLD